MEFAIAIDYNLNRHIALDHPGAIRLNKSIFRKAILVRFLALSPSKMIFRSFYNRDVLIPFVIYKTVHFHMGKWNLLIIAATGVKIWIWSS